MIITHFEDQLFNSSVESIALGKNLDVSYYIEEYTVNETGESVRIIVMLDNNTNQYYTVFLAKQFASFGKTVFNKSLVMLADLQDQVSNKIVVNE